MSKSFQELAKEFSAISGPDSVAIERLSNEAWRLLTDSADKIEWPLFGIDPRHINGPDSNWESFADRAGDTGNVRDAHTDVVHSQIRRDGYDWRAKSRGYAAVCEWLDEIVASCSPADQLSRLIRLAKWHSEVYAWARLWDWNDSLKEDDKKIAALENVLTLKLQLGTISVAECEDNQKLNMYCYAQSIKKSDLTTMFRDYYTLAQGLRTWFPALLPQLPIVNTDMPRPTNEKMFEWAERCRQIEAGLLIARGQPEATAEPPKPVELLGTSTQDEPEFVFLPDGDGYFLKGFGEQGRISASGAKGLHDLFRLVQTPGVGVPMFELINGPGAELFEGDSYSKQPAAEKMTINEIKKKRQQFKEDIEEAVDPNEKSRLEGELKDYESSVAGLFGKTSRNGKMKVRDVNNPIDNHRPTLMKRIRTACEKLRKENLKKIADDFDRAVSSTYGCMIYRPAVEGLTWNVTKL